MEKEDVFVGVKRCCVRLVVVVSPVCCRCWAVLVCRCSAAVPPCCCSPAHRWRLVRSGTGWGTGGSCTGSPTGSGSLDWGPPSNAAAHTASPAGGTVTPLFSIISSIKTFDELFIHTICSCKQIYVCIEVFDYCKTQKAQFHLTSSDNHEKKNFCILQQEAAELPHVLSQLPRCNRHIH